VLTLWCHFLLNRNRPINQLGSRNSIESGADCNSVHQHSACLIGEIQISMAVFPQSIVQATTECTRHQQLGERRVGKESVAGKLQALFMPVNVVLNPIGEVWQELVVGVLVWGLRH
jgi:hypothetical protein